MSHNEDFIKGALIGGLVGGVAGLLMAPKSGKELYNDVVDSYNTINSKGCEISKNLKDTAHALLHPFEKNGESQNHAFLIGSAIGAVVAAVAALLLAPQSGNKLRHSLGSHYDDILKKAEALASDVQSKGTYVAEEVADWKDYLMTIVNKLSKSKGKHNNSHLDEILDYATLGLQLFQQLKNRK